MAAGLARPSSLSRRGYDKSPRSLQESECLLERQVAGLTCGELRVEHPAAFDRPPEHSPSDGPPLSQPLPVGPDG